MTSAIPAEPEVLYRKPGTVTAAQTLMWIQFSFLLCCGGNGTITALFWADIIDELGIGGEARGLLGFLVWAAAGFVATAVLYGILAAKLGAGRRWTQAATVVAMLAAVVFCFVGMATGFGLDNRTGGPVEGSSFVVALLATAMPMATLICLCTGSANQWFRQRGREPWLRHWKGAPPRY
ncbi:hypothetical protein [Glycomyces tarimensis]